MLRMFIWPIAESPHDIVVLEMSQLDVEVWCCETLPDAPLNSSGWNKCITDTACLSNLQGRDQWRRPGPVKMARKCLQMME